MSFDPTLAAIRFGTGLSPSVAPPSDVAEMLYRLGGPDRIARAYPQPGWDQKIGNAVAWVRLRRARKDGGQPAEDAFRAHNRAMTEAHHADLGRAFARAMGTEDGFRERLAWFWADHFAVANGQGFLRRTVAGYHEDAIRPHIAGRFEDLLTAAVTHPAMVAYLDQRGSTGPNSPQGRRGRGLNENLARELLELHTLGVGAAYGQSDVRQLAELLSGLSITKAGQKTFQPNRAEPGPEEVLGRSYGGGPADPEHIRAVLRDLAVHPETANHICRKLAVHFVSDTPEPDLVASMVARWAETEGDLMAVYAALLDHPAAWSKDLVKVRPPFEFIAAAGRALGIGDGLEGAGIRTIRDAFFRPLSLMGQRWQHPPGPDGWPEDARAWITPQGLSARIEWAMRAPSEVPDLPDPRAFVDVALADLASPRTRFAAQAAEDRAAGIGLVLSAPDFQRR
ncbi:MAG: DUF1800 domain-containing protein [Pseudomonadota bacterium]